MSRYNSSIFASLKLSDFCCSYGRERFVFRKNSLKNENNFVTDRSCQSGVVILWRENFGGSFFIWGIVIIIKYNIIVKYIKTF